MMRKKGWISVLIVVALGAGAYAYVRRPPKFEGEYAGVHENLWKFAKSVDPQERFADAVRIRIAMAIHELSPEKSLGLSADEEKAAGEAAALVDSTTRKAVEFESRLTAADVAWITQENPDSFFKYAGFYSSAGNQKAKCKRDRYLALREKLGPRALFGQGPHLGAFVSSYESGFSTGYLRKTIELLRRESRFVDFRELADTYYTAGIDLLPEVASISPDAEAHADPLRTKYAEGLVAAGAPKGELRDYAFKLAAQWPDCVGRISVEFFDFLKDDLTRERGKVLLGVLGNYVRTQRKIPDGVDELPLDETDPVFGKVVDGWYREFVLSREGGVLKLASPGKDGRSGTADDIAIGEVSVPGG